jgi:hypothetical protein
MDSELLLGTIHYLTHPRKTKCWQRMPRSKIATLSTPRDLSQQLYQHKMIDNRAGAIRRLSPADHWPCLCAFDKAYKITTAKTKAQLPPVTTMILGPSSAASHLFNRLCIFRIVAADGTRLPAEDDISVWDVSEGPAKIRRGGCCSEEFYYLISTRVYQVLCEDRDI